jgi:uncharacterized protein YlxW (UPF0749 family)
MWQRSDDRSSRPDVPAPPDLPSPDVPAPPDPPPSDQPPRAEGTTDLPARADAPSAEAPTVAAPGVRDPAPAGASRRWSLPLIAGLCALLGFAIVVQVRRTDSGDTLATARPQDLVVILDGLNRRGDELSADIAELERTLNGLRRGGASSQEALEEARRQASVLAMLAGTAPAFGPGVRLLVTDPSGGVPPEVLLAALQELRNAGAEAISVNEVRLGLDSYFSGQAGSISADGTALHSPYEFRAIGDPSTLVAALNIPGGVSDTVKRAGGSITVEPLEIVQVTATRAVRSYEFARPAEG